MSKLLYVAFPVLSAALLGGCSKDLSAYALASGSIIGFKTSSPGTINSDVAITGLKSGESIVQLSYQPSTGTLYCITNNNLVCTVSPTTGVATLVSTTSFAISGTTNVALTDPVMAIDPVSGDLRVISSGSSGSSSTAYNLLVSPEGALVGGPVGPTYTTQSLSYSSGTPALVAIAYSDPIANAPSTTLYGLDQTSSSLVRIGNADVTTPATVDTGDVTVIGALGLTLSQNTGFTIDQASGTAYASLQDGGGATLYTIDLSSGTPTEVGLIGDGTETVTSLVIVPGD